MVPKDHQTKGRKLEITLYIRYSELIDKKYFSGLSEDEQQEVTRLSRELDKIEDSEYVLMIETLEHLLDEKS